MSRLAMMAALTLLWGCASGQPSVVAAPLGLKGDFGAVEAFVGQRLWQLDNTSPRYAEFTVVENGNALMLSEGYEGTTNRWTFLIRKTAQPGVFTVKRNPKSASIVTHSARLDPDGALRLMQDTPKTHNETRWEPAWTGLRRTPPAAHEYAGLREDFVSRAEYEAALANPTRAYLGRLLTYGQPERWLTTAQGHHPTGVYRFVGLAGTPVVATLRTPGPSVLTLYDPNGDVMTSAESSSGQASVTATLPVDGVYFLSMARSGATDGWTIEVNERTP